MRALCLLSVTTLLFPGASFARTVRVPADYATIQAAINSANEGDMILVAPGAYFENLHFTGKTITVASENGPEVTVIDGSNAGPVVQFSSLEGHACVLRGFTLQHGADYFGAGIHVGSSSPSILDNIFQYNVQFGGGFGAAIGGNGASPIIEGNIFRNNSADDQFLSGAVSFVNESSPWIANNIFVSNSCRAISFTLPAGSYPVVINNTLVGNQVGVRVNAGGVSAWPHQFFNNVLAGNGVGLDVDGAPGNYPSWANNLVFGYTNYQGISDQTGINGNISVDPLFVCMSGDDFRLQAVSPCVDAGSNVVLQLPSDDIGGNQRVIAGHSEGPAIVDMGAYEFEPAMPPVVVCPPSARELKSLVLAEMIGLRASLHGRLALKLEIAIAHLIESLDESFLAG